MYLPIYSKFNGMTHKKTNRQPERHFQKYLIMKNGTSIAIKTPLNKHLCTFRYISVCIPLKRKIHGKKQ